MFLFKSTETTGVDELLSSDAIIMRVERTCWRSERNGLKTALCIDSFGTRIRKSFLTFCERLVRFYI